MIRSSQKILALAVLASGAFLLGGNPRTAHAQTRNPTARGGVRDDRGVIVPINEKLARIILPAIEFRQTTLNDAVAYLRQESRRLDVGEPDPERRGVNIFVQAPAIIATVAGAPATSPADVQPAGSIPAPSVRITLSMNRIPLLEALKYVAVQAGLKVKIEPYAVSLVPLADASEALNTATFRVPPTFIPTAAAGAGKSPLD
jgi:general secretion pathway protein D